MKVGDAIRGRTARMVGAVGSLATFGPGMARFLLAKLLREREVRLNLKIGSVLVRPDDSDMAALREVFQRRDYDVDALFVGPAIRARYERLLAEGRTPVIIDAGANIGATALWFSKIFPRARIVSVEPEPENFRILCENTRSLPNVRAIPAAIGSEGGFVSVRRDRWSWGVTTQRAEEGVPIVTVPQCLEGEPGGALFLVKIDIEGFESDLFAANTQWLDDADVVIVEPDDWLFPGRGVTRTFQNALAVRGFEIHICEVNLVYVRPQLTVKT